MKNNLIRVCFVALMGVMGMGVSHALAKGGSGHPPHVTTLELSATRTCHDDGTQEITWQTTTQASVNIVVQVFLDLPNTTFQFFAIQAVNSGKWLHVADAASHTVTARRMIRGEGTVEETLIRSTMAC